MFTSLQVKMWTRIINGSLSLSLSHSLWIDDQASAGCTLLVERRALAGVCSNANDQHYLATTVSAIYHAQQHLLLFIIVSWYTSLLSFSWCLFWQYQVVINSVHSSSSSSPSSMKPLFSFFLALLLADINRRCGASQNKASMIIIITFVLLAQ